MKSKNYKKILVYTFKTPNQIVYKLLTKIDKDITKYFVGSLKQLQKSVREEKFDYIMGLGNYRKNAKYIRIENKFTNKYGRKEIIANGENIYFADWELNKKEGVVNSNTPTLGPCNRSAYVLLDLIRKEKLNTKFAFIHIPKKYDFNQAFELLLYWLEEIKI